MKRYLVFILSLVYSIAIAQDLIPYDINSFQTIEEVYTQDKVETSIKEGIVSRIKSVNKNVSDKEANHYADLVWQYSAKNKTDVFVTLAIMEQESTYKHWVTAPYPDESKGLMQVREKVHVKLISKHRRKGETVYTPRLNVEVATTILSDCMRRGKGSMRKALYHYSGGSYNYADQVLNRKNKIKHHVIQRVR